MQGEDTGDIISADRVHIRDEDTAFTLTETVGATWRKPTRPVSIEYAEYRTTIGSAAERR